MIGCQYRHHFFTSTVVALLHLGSSNTHPHAIDIESNYYQTSELNNGVAQFTQLYIAKIQTFISICVIHNFFVEKRETLYIKN